MRIHADCLTKSRHGIWYYRWAVPEAIRRQHLELPKELKRSTRTADTRLARGIARRTYATRDAARQDVFDYIEVFYNRTRCHSHLGGPSPEAFELAAA